MDFQTRLSGYSKVGKVTSQVAQAMKQFYKGYRQAAIANGNNSYEDCALTFLDSVVEVLEHPFAFAPFHQRLLSPIDYYHFGLDFIRPLVILEHSKVLHLSIADRITSQLEQGENAILFANHQTELDPQAISLLLENTHPRLAEEMIFVAGHRVISDPMAIPFSKGRNLLCIYSKKYVEDESSRKQEKLLHNQQTMKRMTQLLSEGGKCIYVAPSGGRDRRNSKGQIEVAPFDPQSIEMCWLMAKQAEVPTHFYPLTLFTYHLLPPPDQVNPQLGEPRSMAATPIRLAFGDELDMEQLPGEEGLDKKQKRLARAEAIWTKVCQDYCKLVDCD
jgi:glycerol-3-phosphate O-acyltransferase